ncbi:hypothetical protein J2R98_001658 [Alkalibacillus filiformis]|uniref:Uncharacterized protein n=1 Tax=Alkalibacillus filiformis TaxID=200990 RepID=A0ABU0DTR2_9BACI|nr:hypothetical protein [Alkalibacillus filiformis]MDQ0351826.1 hypothetical protein [Alkalibacillus filiformis]
MKVNLLILLLITTLALSACNHEPEEHEFTFKGESENWSVEITGVFSPGSGDVYEEADAVYTYEGEEDEIRSVVIHTYALGERVRIGKEEDRLSSMESVETNFRNYSFWTLNDQGHDMIVDFKWREGDQNTKVEETITLEFIE